MVDGVEDQLKACSRPKWRDDPSESFSHWKIEIVSADDSKCSQTYHVHKTFLAHGPRRCEYFVKLMRNEDRFRENQTKTSRIELHPLAAKTFPVLLDFVYGYDHSITTETASAFRYLGGYFGVNATQNFFLCFVRKDISLANLHVYYSHAQQLCDKRLLRFVSVCLAISFQIVLPHHSIVTQSTPQLWLEVLDFRKTRLSNPISAIDNIHLSKIIATMCMSQKETLDFRHFSSLRIRSCSSNHRRH